MKVKLSFLNCALLCVIFIHSICLAGTIDVQIKGIDDGVRATKQQDYKEAVLFAKREAIERAGVKIKSITTVKDMVVNSDYIESKAEAILMPGYNIIDIGYSADGTYQVVLVGEVRTNVSEAIASKELRYAKSLFDMGKSSDAKDIINGILKDSEDDNTVAEAMYCQVLWNFSSDPTTTYAKLQAYYPDSSYVAKLKNLIDERNAEKERIIAEKEGIIHDKKNHYKQRFGLYELPVHKDGHFYFFESGVVVDTETNLMWAKESIRGDWHKAKRYCEQYSGAGFHDWRMPTTNELATLQNKEKMQSWKLRKAHGEHVWLPGSIIEGGCYSGTLWASETYGNKAMQWWYGRAVTDDGKIIGNYTNVLPVRKIR